MTYPPEEGRVRDAFAKDNVFRVRQKSGVCKGLIIAFVGDVILACINCSTTTPRSAGCHYESLLVLCMFVPAPTRDFKW